MAVVTAIQKFAFTLSLVYAVTDYLVLMNLYYDLMIQILTGHFYTDCVHNPGIFRLAVL